MNNYEFTYVHSGTLEWLINDQLVVTRPNDLLLTHPGDKLAILNDSFPRSDAWFFQLDSEKLQCQNSEQIGNSLKNRRNRKVAFGADHSRLFDAMLLEQKHPDPYSSGLCRGWLFEILALVLRGEKHQVKEDSMSFKKQVISYLEENLEREITIDIMAADFGYSESHFRTVFRRITGTSPIQLLRQLRIETAQRLIREERHSLTEIAFKVGFNSQQYFSNTFKKEVGISPRAYQKAIRDLKCGKVVHDQFTTIQVMDMHFMKEGC